MKKILIVLTALFALALPMGNAFAAESNLLFGKDLTFGSTASNTTFVSNYATDGDNTTYNMLSAFSGSTDTVHYTFSEPVHVTSLVLNGDTGLEIKLYNEANTIIYSNSSYSNGGTNNLNHHNVKKLVITNNFSITKKINEISLMGSIDSTFDAVTNLIETHTHNTATLSWTNPTATGFNGVLIKQDGVQIADLSNTTSSYNVSGLNSETSYNFEVIAKYNTSDQSTPQSITVLTDPMPVDNTPTSDITNLSSGVSETGVTFMYDLPVDTDFSHLKIYRDGELIEDNYTSNTFSDSGLSPNTAYVYKFVAVDLEGNLSSGYISTITTEVEVDSTAPVAPEGLQVTNGNSSASITWDKSLATDLSGYNIYVDGVKMNTSLILSTNYILSNLENGTTYTVHVTAVDTSGNESLASVQGTILPSAEALPIFDMQYELSDVAQGTSTWFQSLWPILAFAVGITLAFYVGSRIKQLFFA